MATNTYVALQKTTLTTATNSVTLSSIPQGYTDLVLVFNGTESANQFLAFQVNSDTGSNYSWTRMYGDGSAAYSSRGTSTTFGRLGIGDPTNRTLTITNFMNYSNATTYKNTLGRSGTNGGSFTGTSLITGTWRNTAAITTISVIASGSTTFVTGSTFTLYGIKAA